MNFYKTAEGKWVGTQADAGNKNVIEIPCTSKPDMLEWLNANCKQSGSDNSIVDSAGDTIPTTTNPSRSPDQTVGKCPKCKLTHKGAERMAEGMEIDAIAKKIDKLEGWQLSRLMESVIERCVELKGSQDGKSC